MGVEVEAGLSSLHPSSALLASALPWFPWLLTSTCQMHSCPWGNLASDYLLLRVESMSLADRGNPGNITSRLVEKEKARDCLIPMG